MESSVRPPTEKQLDERSAISRSIRQIAFSQGGCRSGTAAGYRYKAFWYVPEVGRWAKSVEEYYGSNGVRNERYTGARIVQARGAMISRWPFRR